MVLPRCGLQISDNDSISDNRTETHCDARYKLHNIDTLLNYIIVYQLKFDAPGSRLAIVIIIIEIQPIDLLEYVTS